MQIDPVVESSRPVHRRLIVYVEGPQDRAILKAWSPRAESVAFDWFTEAMEHFEAAEKHSPEGNDDARLRWNACARTIMERKLERAEDDDSPMLLE